MAEFVRSRRFEINTATPSVCLGSSGRKDGKHLRLTDKANCRTVVKVLQAKYRSLLQRDLNSRLFKRSGKTAFKPVVSLPTKTQCCGKNIKMDNRPSFPLVYTMRGTYVGAMFHGQCEKCKVKYYPSYKMSKEGLVKRNPVSPSNR